MTERCEEGRIIRYDGSSPYAGATDLGQCPICDGDWLGCVDEIEILEEDMFPEEAATAP